MKVLITGGAGFIGSHTAELCVAHGHDVTIVDDFSTGKLSNLSEIKTSAEIIELDVRDAAGMLAVCRGQETILHLAAVSSVEKSMLEPQATHDINTGGSLNVMDSARRNEIGRVVFASSAAVYGDAPELPKTETSPTSPQSPYAWHKLTGEFYGSLYQKLYGVDFVALRYFNVYGPRQDPSSPYSGVLSIFADRAARNQPLTIFGDGEQTRDFIHVSDIATVNVLALETSGTLPNIINVSTGRETRINDVAKIIQAGHDSRAGIVNAESRPGDISRSYASTTLLVDTFGYQPGMQIEEGLATIG